MFDVLVAVDGPPALNDCLSSATRCPRAPFCAPHRVWGTVQSQAIATLKAARIDMLVAETQRLAPCAPGPQPVTWA